MTPLDLHPRDVFVECDPDVWAGLSNKAKREYKLVTADRFLGFCTAQQARVHWRTSSGDWCISTEAPLTRIVVKPDAKQRPKQRTKLHGKRAPRPVTA